MSRSGIEYINSQPDLSKQWIERAKQGEEKRFAEHPDSLIPVFAQELREIGYEFDVTYQIKGFMPKHKEVIFPIAIRYYQQAKGEEKSFFLDFFRFKGFEEVIPLLLKDFFSNDPHINRWAIGACLYQIRSKKYIDDYLKIISNSSFGQDRQMIILLVGKLKVEAAIPILIDLLEDEGVRLHAIVALGDFKQQNLRHYFERFQNAKHSGWRKYAKAALKKLDT